MLKNLSIASSSIPEQIVNKETIEEYKISPDLARKLSEKLKLDNLRIDAHTSSTKTSSGNYAIFPNQFFHLLVHFMNSQAN